jgi:hypothetical protein
MGARRGFRRYKVGQQGPDYRVQGVRDHPRTYEVAPTGVCYGLEPSNGWARGEIVRATVPVFSPPEWIPMYDPTLLSNPHYWHNTPVA